MSVGTSRNSDDINYSDDPFRQIISSAKELEEAIVKRLPESANVYNLMKWNQAVPELGVNWYILETKQSSNSWIVATCWREDSGTEYIISPPKDAEVTDEIKDAFRNSKIFQWTQRYLIAGVDSRLATFLYQLTVLERGNASFVDACVAYTMPKNSVEEFCQQETSAKNLEVKIGRLTEKSDADFLVQDCPWAGPGTRDYVLRMLKLGYSRGVFRGVNNTEIASGVILKSHGAIGMLRTDAKHQRKGYAKSAIRAITADMAANGLVPCCHVSANNQGSKIFHEKLGFVASHQVCYFSFGGNAHE